MQTKFSEVWCGHSLFIVITINCRSRWLICKHVTHAACGTSKPSQAKENSLGSVQLRLFNSSGLLALDSVTLWRRFKHRSYSLFTTATNVFQLGQQQMCYPPHSAHRSCYLLHCASLLLLLVMFLSQKADRFSSFPSMHRCQCQLWARCCSSGGKLSNWV